VRDFGGAVNRAITAEALINEFVEQAIVQATAPLAAKSNQAARKLAAIYRELRELGPASLAEFGRLIDHDQAVVRLWAASYALEFNPTAAEPVIEALSAGAHGPIRASAYMTLREWRGGRLKFP
jgi:hypothetical protein